MRRAVIFLAVIAVVGAAALGLSAQQEVQSRPGPGTGVMDVRVVNHPAVTATQNGTWEVGLSRPADVRIINRPSVEVSGPDFIQMNTTYRVTWSATETESVRVTAAGGGGWVRVSSSGAERWINLNQARSVEVAR